MEQSIAKDIEKSPKDLNRYDLFTLENNLQCLLIQDNNQKEIEKGGNMASVSLSVNCGCLNDPMQRQGLAHFLEHMIFMGSSKYPNENAFANVISSHGGYSNAYTELEYTNYQFRVDYKGLLQALDMFAWLLKEPLLSEDSQEREIQSIESEFEGNYPYDSSRRYQLLCSNTSDKKHIINRFTWGNIKSLKGSKPKELIKDVQKFFQEQYSADRMRLVVQVKTEDDMKEVKAKVVEAFGIIPNKQLGIQNFSYFQGIPLALPYEKNSDQMIIFNAVKNSNVMFLLFTFKKEHQHSSTQALNLLSQILGHEGKGSLYQNLKQQELVISLSSRFDTQFRTIYYTFELTLSLTEKGLLNYLKVIAAIFAYMELIGREIKNYQEFDNYDFFRQIRQLSEVGFYYYKIPDQIDNVCELANEMLFTEDPSQIIKDSYSAMVVVKQKLENITKFVDQMTLDKCKITLSGKNILDRDLFKKTGKKPQTEQWFKTKFKLIPKQIKEISQLIQDYDMSNVKLPGYNPLVPDDFKFKAGQIVPRNEKPQLLKKEDKFYEI